MVLHGPRVARQGQLRLGCSAILLNAAGDQVLLTRRSDNGTWCLPGGQVDPGERVSESVEREFLEETGMSVRTKRLVGVYSDPDQLVVYPDGNKVHMIVLCFLVDHLSGDPKVTDETIGLGFFSIEHATAMDLFHGHAEHILDALRGNQETLIK